MRIDSSGNFGLGTTSNYDDSPLEVRKTAGGDGVAIRVTNNTTTDGSQSGIIFTTTTSDFTSAAIAHKRNDNALIFYNGQSAGGGGFANATERMRIDSSGVVKLTQSGNNPRYGSLEASGDAFKLKAFSGNASHNATMQFFTGADSPTERMRIDSSGRLIAGLTATWDASIGHQFRAVSSSGWALNANSTNTGSSNHLLVTTGRNSSGDNMILVETNHGALGGAGTTQRFKVNGDGTIYATNTTVQSASDERLKENIRNSEDGLAVINQLRPVRFDWRQDQTYNEGTNKLGFIAQEVEQAFPEAVGIAPLPSDFIGEDPQYKTVAPGAFIPVLVKALQEASAKIETLEAKVAALES